MWNEEMNIRAFIWWVYHDYTAKIRRFLCLIQIFDTNWRGAKKIPSLKKKKWASRYTHVTEIYLIFFCIVNEEIRNIQHIDFVRSLPIKINKVFRILYCCSDQVSSDKLYTSYCSTLIISLFKIFLWSFINLFPWENL